MAIFPGQPELAGFIGAKDDESGGDNWSYKTHKAPVKSSPPTNKHPTFYRCRPTNSIKAVKGSYYQSRTKTKCHQKHEEMKIICNVTS